MWLEQARQAAEMPPNAFAELWEAAAPAARNDLLRGRFRYNRDEFLRYVLPGVFDQPWNDFHAAVLRSPKDHWSEQLVTTLTLNLAPRGTGKSTVKKGDVAHSIVYGLRRFVVVVAATRDDAKSWAQTLRTWFRERTDTNGVLWDLFGPFQVTGEQQRFTVHAPAGPTTILCASVNTSLQGANEETHRPDELILDDWEDRKRVKSETIRRDWDRKLSEEMLKLGDRTRGMAVESNVTINHPEAPSAKIRRGEEPFRGWQVREFPAIRSWPERADLWETCKRFYFDLTLGDYRRQAALAFYQANRAEMDRGAEVLDPVAQPLFRLYELIWTQGLSAFMREMQHVTRVPGSALFDSTRFARCRVETHPVDGLVIVAADGRRVLARDCHRKVARWDPCQGVPGGDNGAIAVVLRDLFGYGYVVDCWRRNAPVSAQLEVAWTLAEKWGLGKMSLESNGFQATIDLVFRPQRLARQKAGRFWQLALELDPSTGNKEDRLAGLEAPTSALVLQFAEHLDPEVVGEFDEFDGIKDSHKDDAHDAIEGAWSRSGGMTPAMVEGRVR